ncbi:ribbon-helix-helix protein, CopG family [Coleofasciculus sp. FACHB-64]|uniref:ribbon-helix-helix domain-containing protein n=1 Tax=Cyanophyceae TaxID=3028117 RepID=UPI0032207830
MYRTEEPAETPMIEDMAKVTVTLYMDEEDKEALQRLADAEERSLSQMAVLILKRAIKQAQGQEKILPSQGQQDE